MSQLARGIAASSAFILGGSIAIALIIVGLDVRGELSDDALAAIAQVGATLLVAYAVEMSWLIKTSKVRGGNRENWVGFVVGIGLCSALGIVFAIAFIGQASTSFIEAFAATRMIFSLGFLGLLVAFLPYVLYEWVHAIHTDYSDE